MDRKLFLCSSFKDVVSELAGDLEGLRVSFIPTASIVESVTFYVHSAIKAFEKRGAIVEILDILQETEATIRDVIERNDVIYLSGGNSFFLLESLRNSGADQIIFDAVNSGKLFIGESAGAIVSAPNIAYISAMDSPEKAPMLENYAGLNLVDFYVVPHYTNTPFKKSAHQVYETYHDTLDLRVMSNHEVLRVDGDSVLLKSV